jgi:hypothetical protein
MENNQITELVGEMTARLLKKAKEGIDTTFGDGYAKEHPELVSKCMEVSSTIFSDMMLHLSSNNNDYDLEDMEDMEDYEDEDDEDDIDGLFQN